MIKSTGQLLAFLVSGQSSVPRKVFFENKDDIYFSYLNSLNILCDEEGIEIPKDELIKVMDKFYISLTADSAISFPILVKSINDAPADHKTFLKKLYLAIIDEAPIKNELITMNKQIQSLLG